MKRATLTDAEIEGFMDFDALITKAQTKSVLGRWALYTGIALVAGIIGFGIWVTSQHASETVTDSQSNSQQITPDPQQESRLPANNVDSVATVIEPVIETGVIKKSESKKKGVQSETTTVLDYRQAAPAGGYEKLYQYLNEAIRYPETAVRDSIQGVVVVDFVVNKSGGIEQLQIQQSLRADCDKEAIRVIENMETWLPALLHGKPVQARVSVPLTFQLIQTH